MFHHCSIVFKQSRVFRISSLTLPFKGSLVLRPEVAPTSPAILSKLAKERKSTSPAAPAQLLLPIKWPGERMLGVGRYSPSILPANLLKKQWWHQNRRHNNVKCVVGQENFGSRFEWQIDLSCIGTTRKWCMCAFIPNCTSGEPALIPQLVLSLKQNARSQPHISQICVPTRKPMNRLTSNGKKKLYSDAQRCLDDVEEEVKAETSSKRPCIVLSSNWPHPSPQHPLNCSIAQVSPAPWFTSGASEWTTIAGGKWRTADGNTQCLIIILIRLKDTRVKVQQSNIIGISHAHNQRGTLIKWLSIL